MSKFGEVENRDKENRLNLTTAYRYIQKSVHQNEYYPNHKPIIY
jgi:hypothetical protein